MSTTDPNALDDGYTPPIILNPSVNTIQNQQSLAVIFTVIVGFFVVFFLVEIFVVKLIMGSERWEKVKCILNRVRR
jgi:hypothetical protein